MEQFLKQLNTIPEVSELIHRVEEGGGPAAVTGLQPVQRACVGAAILAGVGCGIYRDASDGYRHLAVGERVLQSDPNRAALYQELFEKYKQNAAILSNMDT